MNLCLNVCNSISVSFVRSSELVKNPHEVLVQTLEVMQLYQQLSPTLFAQVGFSVAKLLSETAGAGGILVDPRVLSATLKLVMEASQESFRCLLEVRLRELDMDFGGFSGDCL